MNGPAKKSEPLHEVTIQLLVMFGLLAILFIGVTVINNNFVSVFSLRAVSRDVAIMSLFALGQAVVIMSGGIDLSVGSLMCFLGADPTAVSSESEHASSAMSPQARLEVFPDTLANLLCSTCII